MGIESDFPKKIELSAETAPLTYGKSRDRPVEIKAGETKMRARAIAGVYAETGHDWNLAQKKLALLSKKFIKVEIGDEPLYLNVNSLSKRLGIPIKKITSKVNANNAEILQLLTEYYERYQFVENRINTIFAQSQQHYATAQKNIEDPEFLKRVIGISVIADLEAPESKHTQAFCKLLNGTFIHLSKQNEGEFPLVTQLTGEDIDEGGYAKVTEAKILLTGEDAVVKVGHSPKQLQKIHHYTKKEAKAAAKLAQHSTKNELTILNKIHERCQDERRPVGNIQDRGVDFAFPLDGMTQSTYISSRYDRNLKSIVNSSVTTFPKDHAIDCGRQLLQGLETLAAVNIAHGDIKPANILVRSQNGKTEYALADFGGAVDLENSTAWPTMHTPDFEWFADKLTYEDLKASNSNGEMKKLLLKHDVYAMGICLKMVFAGCKKNLTPGQQGKLDALINSMCNPNWKNRPKAHDALKIYNQIFSHI